MTLDNVKCPGSRKSPEVYTLVSLIFLKNLIKCLAIVKENESEIFSYTMNSNFRETFCNSSIEWLLTFRNQGSYRLWNSGKTMEFCVKRPYLWKNYGIFVLVGKGACFLKKMGGKYVWTSKCGFNVCYFDYHFTRPSSMNLPG